MLADLASDARQSVEQPRGCPVRMPRYISMTPMTPASATRGNATPISRPHVRIASRRRSHVSPMPTLLISGRPLLQALPGSPSPIAGRIVRDASSNGRVDPELSGHVAAHTRPRLSAVTSHRQATSQLNWEQMEGKMESSASCSPATELRRSTKRTATSK